MRKLHYLSLLLAGTAFTVSAADVAITVGGGTGTEADPYIISAPAHLVELADACNNQGTTAAANSHFSGKYFKMTADIDMSGVEDFLGIGTAGRLKSSSNSAFYFDGVFDGGGHTIRNMSINGIAFKADGSYNSGTGTAEGTSRNYIGLFGTLWYNSVVKNVNLDATCTIKACNYAGSIAGYMKAEGSATKPGKGAQIINCSSSATITTYAGNTGGIAGYATRTAANGPISIEGCAFYGTINADYNPVGGIIGYGSRINVLNCANYGTIKCEPLEGGHSATTARTQAGGILGNDQYCAVTNCLNAGYVYASGHTAGGIAGNVSRSGTEGTFTACVNTGSVICPDIAKKGVIGYCSATSASGLPVLTDCYVDGQLSAQMGQPFGTNNQDITGVSTLPTSEMTSGTALAGLDPTIWKFEAGFYPRLVKFDNEIAKRAAATYFVMPAGVDATDFQGEATISSAMSGITATVADLPSVTVNGNKINAAAPTALSVGTITLANGTYSLVVPVMQVPVLFSGSGTEADPYLIKTKTDVMNLMESVNGPTLNHYEGEFFKMTADIDMENDSTFIGIGAVLNNTSAHNTYFFAGTFDGDGHTIRNMALRTVGFNDAGNMTASAKCVTNAGFFGTLSGTATVKNLHFDASCTVKGYAYTGTVAGRMLSGAKLENVSSAAQMTFYATSGYNGGIVGYIDGDKADANGEGTCASVTRALFSGSLKSCGTYNGGITGYNKGLITESVNTGEISAYKFFGTGTNFCWTGGICGDQYGTVTDCANYGPVHSDGQVSSTAAYGRIGGIGGETGTSYNRGITRRNLNTGSVTTINETAGTTGMIIGLKSTSGSPVFEGNVFDSQLSVYGAVNNAELEGNTGMLTTALTAGTAVAALGDKFTFTAGYYPMPTFWASNDAVRRAAATYLTLPANETISGFNTEGVIATTMPLTASLTQPSTVFSIANGKVIAGPTEELAADTLVLTNGTHFNRYPLMKVPAVLPGSGTEADPWQVATAEDFIKIGTFMEATQSSFAGEYFKVMADLDFAGKDFTPVSTTTLAFKGIFDGNGKTIKNLTYEGNDDNQIHHIGLFTNLGEGSVVKNLKLANVKFTGYSYVGGIAANCDGTISGIEIGADCAITGTRKGTSTGTNTDGSYVGSLAAYASQTAAFLNCVNRAPVSTTRWYAGGLVGYVKSAAANVETTARIADCANYGTVTSTVPMETSSSGGGAPTQNYTKACIGGIAGLFAGTISNTVNEGDVTAVTADYIGGFVGQGYANTTITECVNRGQVHGADYVAGFIGYNLDAASYTLPNTLSKCVNEGDILGGQAEATKGNGMYLGGLLGYVGKNWTVADCGNTGSVTSLCTVSTAGHSIGGLISTIKAGSTKVDGVNVSNPLNIIRSYNTGDLTAINQCGGLVAYVVDGVVEIDSCFNTGNLLSTATAKPSIPTMSGIAGGFSRVRNSYNAGDVTGWVAAGIGYGLGSSTSNPTASTAENCYNMGKLTSLNETDPNEVGQIFINNRTGMTVTNCYGLATSSPCEKYDTVYKVQRLDSLQLLGAAEKLGPAFVARPAAFPMIAGLDTVAGAQFAAAWYLLAEGNTLTNVTDPVTLADLKHVVWSCPDEGLFTFEPGKAIPAGKGATYLVATSGSRSKAFAMTAAAGDPEDIVVDGLNLHLDLEKLTAVVMPGEYTGVVNIPAKVTSVNKEYTVIGIAETAFYNTKVTELSIPGTVKTIEKDGCRNMTQLKKVSTPTFGDWLSIEFANGNANPIYNCGNLYVDGTPVGTTLTLPAETQTVNAYAFKGLTSIEGVSLPSGLKSLGNSVFNGCANLKSVEIPDGCTIGESLFFGCSSLESVKFPAGIKEIPSSTFYGCSGLKTMSLPEGVETLGMMAFSGCSGMTAVTIPATTKSIGMMAFDGCSALATFTTLAKTVPTADMMAFDGIDYNACKLIVPEGTRSAYAAADEWKNFTNIEEDMSGVSTITADDIANARFFTPDGREIADPEKGTLVIAVITTTDGKTVTRKMIF